MNNIQIAVAKALGYEFIQQTNSDGGCWLLDGRVDDRYKIDDDGCPDPADPRVYEKVKMLAKDKDIIGYLHELMRILKIKFIEVSTEHTGGLKCLNPADLLRIINADHEDELTAALRVLGEIE